MLKAGSKRVSRSLSSLQEHTRFSGPTATRNALRAACRRLPISSFSRCRGFSTRNTNATSDSIFSSDASPWDHIWNDLDVDIAPPPKPRRQTMTDSERATIIDLLRHSKVKAGDVPVREKSITEKLSELKREADNTRRFKTKDVVLDEMVDAMSACQTKAELLDWAHSKVFQEFDKASTDPFNPEATAQLMRYPSLIPKLMDQFRQRFSDPHLALAVFKHAKTRSMTSYVLGCSTGTYNTLIATVWDSCRDLGTVSAILQDMVANSVVGDRQTEIIVERLSREATEDKLWLDQSSDGEQLSMRQLSTISELMMELLSLAGNKYATTKRGHDWKLGKNTDYEFNNF